MKHILLREYRHDDIGQMTDIWNEVVLEGKAFPQEDTLSNKNAADFFETQTACGVAECDGKVVGLYILHPTNIGRCAHNANASYAVASSARGNGVGRLLVKHSLENAVKYGFVGIQFNAVVSTNSTAIALYESLCFEKIGRIPNGFRNKDGTYTDTFIFFRKLN